MWYRNQDKCSKFVLRKSGQGKNLIWFKVLLALLYKWTSEERSNGNPPAPINLSWYTLHPPPSNHSSCSDITSNYPTMNLDTTMTTLINATTPQHPRLQHLRPLPYLNKLYRHHLIIFTHHLHVYPHVCLSVTPIPSICPILFPSTLQSIAHNPSRDSIPLLALWSSENILERPWLQVITLMKLHYCLQPIPEPCRFPCRRIIPSAPYKVLELTQVYPAILNIRNLIFFFTNDFHRSRGVELLSHQRVIRHGIKRGNWLYSMNLYWRRSIKFVSIRSYSTNDFNGPQTFKVKFPCGCRSPYISSIQPHLRTLLNVRGWNPYTIHCLVLHHLASPHLDSKGFMDQLHWCLNRVSTNPSLIPILCWLSCKCHSRVNALYHIQWDALSSLRRPMICCKLSQRKPVHTVILLMMYEQLGILFHTRVLSFCLSISLRVESCWHSLINPQPTTHLLPKGRG